MPQTKFAILARISPALALLSCAAPKAIVIELPPKSNKPATGEAALANAIIPPLPNDGIRLPDMLAMPGDGEFRAPPAKASDAGAVIARPPTDPPSRPKPKAAGAE